MIKRPTLCGLFLNWKTGGIFLPWKKRSRKPAGWEKIATFIVDRRNLFFLLYALALIFSIVASGWVKVENDITTYLPADTETRQGLTVMNDNFTTFGTARVMVSNVTYDTATDLASTIEDVDGVYSVEFDDTADHYKQAAALYTVTFDGTSTDDISLQALDGIRKRWRGTTPTLTPRSDRICPPTLPVRWV